MLRYLTFFFLSGIVCLSGQDFSAVIPGAVPTGGGGAVFSDLDSSFSGFSYGVNAKATYYENVNLQESGGDDAFILALGADLSYQTVEGGSSLWRGAVTYSPSYQFFFTDEDLPGAFAQNGSLALTYLGASVTATVSGNLSTGGGQNVLVGGFVDTTNYSLNASLDWNYSAKTSVGITGGFTSADFGDLSGSNDRSSIGIRSLWQATPLVRLGPYVNWSSLDTGSAGKVDSIGYGLNLAYDLTGKTSLSGSFGFQNQDFENGGSNTAPFGSLSVSWTPTDLYSVSVALATNTVALPSTSNLITNNYSFSTVVARNLDVGGSVAFRASINYAQVEATGATTDNRDDREFYNLSLSLNRPVFANRLNLNSSVGYGEGTGGQNFSGLNSSIGLSYDF